MVQASNAEEPGDAANAEQPAAAEEEEIFPVGIRRTVPNDHSCLFYAIAYCSEGKQVEPRRIKELREICAADALSDEDQEMRALMLGASTEEYAEWIRDDTHWGGENEIMTLAKHYGVEIAVIVCESLRVLCYGSDNGDVTDRIYLLYTGQHYDPLVVGPYAECMPEEECGRFPKGDASLEKTMLRVARRHNEEIARRQQERRVKRLQCKGCGQFVNDADEFSRHCQEVEHGEDFAYECEEVEIVLQKGEPLPDGAIDFRSEDVFTFYNTEQEPLSMGYAAPVRISGIDFPTLEHYWQAAPYIGRNTEVVEKVREAPTPNEAIIVAQEAGADTWRPDWDAVRDDLLVEAIRAKFTQRTNLVELLVATKEKLIVCVDEDPWLGMQAAGGMPTGRNAVGKALMVIRDELRRGEAPHEEEGSCLGSWWARTLKLCVAPKVVA